MLVPPSKKYSGSVDSPQPSPDAVARAGGQDEGARRHDIRLDALILGRPAAAEGDQSLGVVGHAIGFDRGRRESRWARRCRRSQVLVGRLFSVAPTVMQFFAVLGGLIELASTVPLASESMPSLPAAKQITRSRWFQTKSSSSKRLGVVRDRLP